VRQPSVAANQGVGLKAGPQNRVFAQRSVARGAKSGCLDNQRCNPLSKSVSGRDRRLPLMVTLGQKAPDFSLKALVGKGDFTTVSLSDYRGKWVVLFFYPLDFTSVCPTEIQQFSKRESEFRKMNAAVLGVSVDSVYAHRAWLNGTLGPINFPLLSDLTKETARQFGALLEQEGVASRATIIIDPEGNVQYALYQNAKVGRSIAETMRILEALQTGESCAAEWKRGEATLGP